MDKEAFYITLPSNASIGDFPHNKIGDFSVKMAKPVDLKGAWEVALTEIQYPHTWNTFSKDEARFRVIRVVSVETTDSTVSLPKVKHPLYEAPDLPLPTDVYPTAVSIVETADRRIVTVEATDPQDPLTPVKQTYYEIADLTFPHGVYPSVMSVIEAINRILGQYAEYKSLHLVYDPIQRKTYYKSQGGADRPKFVAAGRLERFLGIVQDAQKRDYEDLTCADVYAGFYTLFLYTDIIQYQRVGDSYAPLLRSVQVKGENNSIVCIQYTKPEYLPLSRAHFDTVNLQIRDDLGNIVSFKYGKVIVKLHLRPARTYDY